MRLDLRAGGDLQALARADDGDAPGAGERFKPDMLIVTETTALIIDTTVAYESRERALLMRPTATRLSSTAKKDS